MKNLIIALFIFILNGSCNKEDIKKINQTIQLPAETQTGANTFGVTIKGKVYIPRYPTGINIGPTTKGMMFWGISNNSWNEIEIKDGASAVGFNMKIHIENLETIGVNKYILKQSNFHNGFDSSPLTHIYFKIWDNLINNYAYYGSIEDQGELNITRLSNGIVSGNFKGRFVRYDNSVDFIDINDGRFDLNTTTVSNHPFP